MNKVNSKEDEDSIQYIASLALVASASGMYVHGRTYRKLLFYSLLAHHQIPEYIDATIIAQIATRTAVHRESNTSVMPKDD